MPASLKKIVLYPFILSLLTGLVVGLYLLYKDTDPPVFDPDAEGGDGLPPHQVHRKRLGSRVRPEINPGQGDSGWSSKRPPGTDLSSKPGQIKQEFTLTDLGLKMAPSRLKSRPRTGRTPISETPTRPLFSNHINLIRPHRKLWSKTPPRHIPGRQRLCKIHPFRISRLERFGFG